MKLLSNFDTQLQINLVKEYQDAFGNDMVITLNKSKFYYWTRIFIPTILLVFSFIFIVFLILYFQINQREILVPSVFTFVLLAIFLFTKIFWSYFNYKMDFLLVTPKEIIKYDQEGFFNRKSERLNANIIKSITVRKEGFIESLFDIGTIVFLTELGNPGVDGSDGEISMDIVDINDTDKKIRHILGMTTK